MQETQYQEWDANKKVDGTRLKARKVTPGKPIAYDFVPVGPGKSPFEPLGTTNNYNFSYPVIFRGCKDI